MSRLRNALRATLLTDPDPARALDVVDHLMALELQEAFTTGLVAIVDPLRRSMSCASAGHPGPLMWAPDETVADPLLERGLPLGLGSMMAQRPGIQSIPLRSGTFVLFFTDGLLEWNRDIATSWERANEALRRRAVRESRHPARAVRQAVIGGSEHQDDIALLTLRVE